MAAAITPVPETIAPSHTPPLRRSMEQAFALEPPADRALHSALAKLSGGFSPMGIAAAWFDWAVHLGASPGRMAEIAQAGLTEAAHVKKR
jgi:polyhydroxyalkanoate synthase subunit PhaC